MPHQIKTGIVCRSNEAKSLPSGAIDATSTKPIFHIVQNQYNFQKIQPRHSHATISFDSSMICSSSVNTSTPKPWPGGMRVSDPHVVAGHRACLGALWVPCLHLPFCSLSALTLYALHFLHSTLYSPFSRLSSCVFFALHSEGCLLK